jgi:hypothetical protein
MVFGNVNLPSPAANGGNGGLRPYREGELGFGLASSIGDPEGELAIPPKAPIEGDSTVKEYVPASMGEAGGGSIPCWRSKSSS